MGIKIEKEVVENVKSDVKKFIHDSHFIILS